MIKYDFTLPPEDAIEYLKSKGKTLTFDYTELKHEAHHKAFTVAKVMKLDLLGDIHESLIEAMKNGTPVEQWEKSIKPTLQKKGWWGEQEIVNPKTGEVKNIYVGSRRLKNIYETNMRVAYSAAQFEAGMSSDAEYIEYVAILDSRVRPSHAKLHGIVLHKSHPFWKKNFPPNGWKCRCFVRFLTKAEVERRGLKVLENPPVENIADPDWAYDIGEGRFFDIYDGTDKPYPKEETYKDFLLPSLAALKKKDLPQAPGRVAKAKSTEEAKSVFYKELLGEEESSVIATPLVDVLIDKKGVDHLVKEQLEHGGSREAFVKYIKPTLEEPLEVWAFRGKREGGFYKKRYKYIKLFKEKNDNTLAVVDIKRDGSLFVTFFKTKDLKYLDKERRGILMYWASGSRFK